jgi:hypothetical protein
MYGIIRSRPVGFPISSRQYTGRSVSLDSHIVQKRFVLQLCPCDVPYTRTMWPARIAAYRGTTLRRHISTRHGLSRDEYLKRWALRIDHPLTAPAYSERRSMLAKELGLGQKPKASAGPVVAPTAAAPKPIEAAQEPEATPMRRRRSRSASNTAGVANETVADPTPARKRRPRSRVA